jgi:hypothetical protein
MAAPGVLQMFRNALRVSADEDEATRTVDLQVGRSVHTVPGAMRTELWLSVLTRNRGFGHAAGREYARMLAQARRCSLTQHAGGPGAPAVHATGQTEGHHTHRLVEGACFRLQLQAIWTLDWSSLRCHSHRLVTGSPQSPCWLRAQTPALVGRWPPRWGDVPAKALWGASTTKAPGSQARPPVVDDAIEKDVGRTFPRVKRCARAAPVLARAGRSHVARGPEQGTRDRGCCARRRTTRDGVLERALALRSRRVRPVSDPRCEARQEQQPRARAAPPPFSAWVVAAAGGAGAHSVMMPEVVEQRYRVG